MKRQQTELLKERTAVESLVRRGLVREATLRLEGMTALKHSALADTVGWAARNVIKARERWTRLESRPSELLSLAENRFDEGDYQGAAAVVEQLDPSNRTAEITAFLEECEGREKRIGFLSRKIRQRVASKEFDGLLSSIDEYLHLKPDDDEIVRLDRNWSSGNGLFRQTTRSE